MDTRFDRPASRTGMGEQMAAAWTVVAGIIPLGTALASERFGGLVPCALCLWERWPYRVAIALGVIGFLLPRRWTRRALALVVLVMLAGAGIAFLHVGVEAGWWPSPLPECMQPHFTGGTIAQRLASMPARPSKSCEDATYLIPGLPVSMALMDLIYALAFACGVAIYLGRSRRGEA